MPKSKSISPTKMSISPMDKLKSLSPTTSTVNLNNMSMANVIIFLIAFAVVIILHYAMYTWTEELEKTGCKCSEIWHRNVIHWIALILLVITFVNILLKIANIQSPMFMAYGVVVGLLSLFYIIIVFDYISKLKALECECSESWKREYGYIYSIISISIYSLAILLSILFGSMMMTK
jgi:magnesium-transporting ATPase (P-type)